MSSPEAEKDNRNVAGLLAAQDRNRALIDDVMTILPMGFERYYVSRVIRAIWDSGRQIIDGRPS